MGGEFPYAKTWLAWYQGESLKRLEVVLIFGALFTLAILTPLSHNASMEEAQVFTIDVAQDARQPGRYRWCVSENTKVRDRSFCSFTTRREAQADADKFVEKAEGRLATPLMTKTPKRSGGLANGETSEGEPAPPTSRDSAANALDRWDEEGGAPAVSWPLPYETGDLLDAERRVLECLGAALVSEWNDLPTDVQRRLFEHAASGKSHDAALLKARIARFLHNHKDDWAAR